MSKKATISLLPKTLALSMRSRKMLVNKNRFFFTAKIISPVSNNFFLGQKKKNWRFYSSEENKTSSPPASEPPKENQQSQNSSNNTNTNNKEETKTASDNNNKDEKPKTREEKVREKIIKGWKKKYRLSGKEKEAAKKFFGDRVITEDWADYKFDPKVTAVVDEIVKFDFVQMAELSKLLQWKTNLDAEAIFKGIPIINPNSLGLMGMVGMPQDFKFEMPPMGMQYGMPYGMPPQGMPGMPGYPPQQQAPAAPTEAQIKEKEREEAVKKEMEANKRYNVRIQGVTGDGKYKVLKEIRKIDTTMKLMEAKAKVENFPATIKEDLPKEEAQKIIDILAPLGADVFMVESS